MTNEYALHHNISICSKKRSNSSDSCSVTYPEFSKKKPMKIPKGGIHPVPICTLKEKKEQDRVLRYIRDQLTIVCNHIGHQKHLEVLTFFEIFLTNIDILKTLRSTTDKSRNYEHLICSLMLQVDVIEEEFRRQDFPYTVNRLLTSSQFLCTQIDDLKLLSIMNEIRELFYQVKHKHLK